MQSYWNQLRQIKSGDGGCGDDCAEELAYRTIGAAIDVHRALGPGLPEFVYEKALCHELTLRDVEHRRQAPVPIKYKGIDVGEGYIDIFVGERLVVELKAVESLNPVHFAQVRAYLCATHLRLGLLINFNADVLRDSIKRIVHTPKPPA